MSPTRILAEIATRIRMSRHLSQRLDEAAAMLARSDRHAAPVLSLIATAEATPMPVEVRQTVIVGDRAA